MCDKFMCWQEIDTEDMLNLIVNFHRQLVEGITIGQRYFPEQYRGFKPHLIVLSGMGGSAISGELLRCYLVDELPVPMIVVRDYELPRFVDTNTLLITASYSGNTEETLSVYADGKKRGAKILAISTGGRIESLAKDDGFPFVKIPSGLPPRAALGYSFTPLLVIFYLLGYITNREAEIRESARLLEQWATTRYLPEIPEADNPAKKLATYLYGKLPLIYTSTRHFEAVGTRFRGQLNENAKVLAYSAVLPEMNHNELVGWKILYQLKEYLAPVIFYTRFDHTAVRFRMNFLSRVMEEQGIKPMRIVTEGENLLSHIFYAIQLGDFTSYYLSILNRVNPYPVEVIDRLKKALSEVSRRK